MAGPALYLIAILGCGEGDASCDEARRVEQRYESREACLAATEAELLRAGDLPYPVVVAQCRPEGAQAEPLTAGEVERREPEPNLHFRRPANRRGE